MNHRLGDDGQPALLDGVDLRLPRGRITALWGPSGAGKSTLVKILERKYPLTGGALLIDGVPAEEFELSDYRRNVASVPESVKIFRGTLADNVLLGRAGLDVPALERCLTRTGLQPFVEGFEAGLRTMVGEQWRRLSSGERQIVGLMRALIEEPAVLVLDEGMSAIDVRVASQVLDALRRYAEEHVVLLISHNLRTLREAEWIYVLDRGRIVETGVPHELLDRPSCFGVLWLAHEAVTSAPA